MVERAIGNFGSSNICNVDKISKTNNKFKKYRKATPKNIKVVNTVLLYSIADAGFLHTHLVSVHNDEEGRKAFYFKNCVEIQDMVNDFNFDTWMDYEEHTRDDYCISKIYKCFGKGG